MNYDQVRRGTLAGLAATLFGCGSDLAPNNGCPAGSERCACYGNQTCNDGLICASGICVNLDGGTDAGQGGNAAGGQAGDSGTGGTVGLGGTTTSGGSSAGGSYGGGLTSTGGSATGGEVSGGTGGSMGGGLTTGGTLAIGGTPGSGGTATSGGAPTSGGTATTGGTPATGGTATSGGAPTSGGTATTGGTPGTGGTATTGGQPVSGGSPGTGGTGATGGVPAGLIDDLEQGTNGALPSWEGRAGCWYTFASEATTMTPVPLPTGSACSFPYSTPGHSSDHAVRAYGKTESSGWAGIGFDLVCPTNNAANKRPYDATGRGYGGISFWAKRGDTAGATSTVRVTFLDRYTDPAGGYCSTCNDNWYKAITLGSAWQFYTVRWTDSLTRQGYGSPQHSFDPSGLMSIQLQYTGGYTFDVWLDDVAFVP